MAERDFATAEKAEMNRYTADSNSSGDNLEPINSLRPELTHDSVLGMQSHGHLGDKARDGDENPYVHQHVRPLSS